MPSAARVPVMVRVPEGKFELVRVVTPFALVEPVMAMATLGATQEVVEFEWRMPVIWEAFPVSSPENEASLAALADAEENCQLPVTVGFAAEMGVVPMSAQPMSERVRTKLAQSAA